MEKFSSVTRLKLIVEKFNRIPNQTSAGKAFSEIFDFDNSDALVAYEYSIDYFNLVERVIDILTEASGSFPFLKQTVEEVDRLKKNALLFNNGQQWQHCRKHSGSSARLALETAEGFYSMYVEHVELRIEDEYISGFKSEVDKLYESVQESDLPRELKLKIYDCLIDIKKSLVKYSISGMDGVEKSMATLFGCVGLNREFVNEDAQPEVFNDVKSFFNKFKSLAEMANTLSQLPSNVQSALTLLTEASDKFKQ
ncbi:hypothetical protein LZG37_00810 [Halomonas titanicae]|uniref:hypothetical protein n=1 Tax=Vreelandella titanicae TaxID=664683 RepID=UPI001F2B2BDB|nr:hypothetical protein [Halomonas titanicae]MCE7516659.1 hypothetical protein [Halomonas titanicae]